MRTVNFDLDSLLRRLRAKQFRIPQFQRNFTWRESQIKLLIDSIARNYPIGSLLVLAQNPEIPRLHSRSVEAVIQDVEEEDNPEEIGSEIYYVLDGQQRLTSIARVFLDAHPSKNYYFDLRRILEEFDQEDSIWIRSRQRGKSNPQRKDKNRLLRTDVALDQEATDIFVSEYIEDSEDFPQYRDSRLEARRAAARIKGIFETIRKYQIPIVVLDQDTPLESVCRVFETINSTGTRLTTFDLAVARFYPSPDLRKLWHEALDSYPLLKEFEVEGERVLQVLSLYNSHIYKKSVEPTRSNLLSLEPKFVIENWDTATEKLAEAYEWARHNGATPKTLPTHGILVAIGAFLMLYPDVFDNLEANIQPVLKRWYFCKVLQQGARQAANYKIGRDFVALTKHMDDGEPLEVPDVLLNADGLNRIKRAADSRYRAIQCIMAMSAKEDLITGRPLNGEMVEDHHIFPRSLHKTHGFDVARLDAITNRILISQKSNNRLGDKHPKEYLRELQQRALDTGTVRDINRRLQECLIPGSISQADFIQQFDLDNYELFLRKRAEMILESIRDIVGDALRTNYTLEDEEDED